MATLAVFLTLIARWRLVTALTALSIGITFRVLWEGLHAIWAGSFV